MMLRILSVIAITAMFCLSANAQICGPVTKISTSLKFADKSVEPVQAWKLGDIATIVVTPGMHVNPDGNARAYSVGDRGLVAIENGVKIWDDGKYKDYSTYLRDYANDPVKSKGFRALWLDAEARGFGPGTREFDAFAISREGGTVVDPRVRGRVNLVGNGKGKPVLQSVEGEKMKYYVAMTSLTQAGFAENDQRRYLDSSSIPAWVLPRLPSNSNAPIDPLRQRLAHRQLAWVYAPKTNQGTYAIAGDTGPLAKFGESTIALQSKLLWGEIYPVPHYRPDARYVTCRPGQFPDGNTDCVYKPYFATRGGRLTAGSFPHQTLWIIFGRDKIVTEPVITEDLIDREGAKVMMSVNRTWLLTCLHQQVPELRPLLLKLP